MSVITLPIEKTKKRESLQRMCILLYAPPKFGKSTFASEADGAVFLPFESGLNSLEVFRIPQDGTLTEWPDALKAQELLITQKHDFKTIVIDTIDLAYSSCQQHMMAKYGKVHESDLGFGKGFTIVTNELYRFVNRFVAAGFGVIMISHATERTFETPTGAEYTKTVPTLANNARKALLGMADAILFGDIQTVTNADGTKTHTRVLRTKPTAHYEAGDRMVPPLPPVIEFRYAKFAEAFKARKSEVKAVSPAVAPDPVKPEAVKPVAAATVPPVLASPTLTTKLPAQPAEQPAAKLPAIVNLTPAADYKPPAPTPAPAPAPVSAPAKTVLPAPQTSNIPKGVKTAAIPAPVKLPPAQVKPNPQTGVAAKLLSDVEKMFNTTPKPS